MDYSLLDNLFLFLCFSRRVVLRKTVRFKYTPQVVQIRQILIRFWLSDGMSTFLGIILNLNGLIF